MEYEEGFNANENDDVSRSACPYDDETLEAECWRQGWDDAEDDRYRNRFTPTPKEELNND